MLNIHFGFSYVGLIYIIMLTVPNLIWAKYKPKNYEKYASNENRILGAFERIGEVLVTTIVLIFSDFNVRTESCRDPWTLFLAVSVVLMIMYELYWIHYFKSERTMKDQYRSFCRVPVAGATLPVAAFFLLGVYGKNIFLVISVIILGIGHIGIHLAHKKEASCE